MVNPRNGRNVRGGRQVYGVRRPSAVPRKSSRPNLDPKLARSGAFAIIGLFALLGIWQVFAVAKIDVKGNKSLSSEQVVKLVNQSFGHHAFSSNLLTLSLAKLPDELPQNSERIQSVAIARSWPNRIVVTVTERTATLGWKSGSQVYALDGNGKVIGMLAELGVPVPVVEDTTNLPIHLGDTVAPARFVAFASLVVQKLPEQGIAATGLRITDTTSEIYVTTNKGYGLKFDTTRRVEEGLGDLKSVLTTLASQKKTPMEYIDLRISGKAYWK